MNRHDDSQRSGRLAVTRPVHPSPFRTEKQLTAPADRPVRALPGDSGRPGSPPVTDCRQDPPSALPAIQTRCFADHHPVWRWAAGADVRRAGGACMMGRARAHTKPILRQSPKSTENRGCKMILKEPHARAARVGVNPASHTPRASDYLTLIAPGQAWKSEEDMKDASEPVVATERAANQLRSHGTWGG